MADETKTAAERVAEDVMAKVNALSADKPNRDEVRAMAAEVVAETLKSDPELLRNAGAYKPEADVDRTGAALLRGSVYEYLGVDLAGVELVHDILEASRVADPRNTGPAAKTKAIVESARKQRSLDTAETGFGNELIADALYTSKLWDAARNQYGTIMSRVESRPMSAGVETHPVLGVTPTMLYYGETTDAISAATAFTTIKPGSNRVTLTANKFIGSVNYSGELVEDSLIPLVPLLQEALSRSQAKTMDYWILNGDTTNAGTGNINLDDADPADTLYYLAGDGVRHAALVDNTGNARNVASAALSYADLIALPGLMLDRTHDQHWGRPDSANDLLYVGSPELDNDILMLDEVANAFANKGMTPVDGPMRGELCRIGRYPYISHTGMALTEADGKVSTTANNNTLGQIACFNVRGLLMGTRRMAQIEVNREPRFDAWEIVLSTRVALGRYTPTGAASGIEWAAVAYAIANN